ncbi:hypothetical protein MAP_0858 [Mycobacterium avium subsp. paratuberculosis K-10]|uniref:Uncharacterized protein n=1 Tax=Mycolicibacterium paratuberculosis (strain ATCC BAA-968 / K-10) TaxID=262316 RepID=Q742H7_MYCPA|nr:hypothetical protein MAP_0858 [Mycobacterium avium subsp. paratuberculosis K-10]AGL37877.1 hypothetical protein MAP4_3002 [Mycobacterium avium subsp. paratuberculosis MAP4]
MRWTRRKPRSQTLTFAIEARCRECHYKATERAKVTTYPAERVADQLRPTPPAVPSKFGGLWILAVVSASNSSTPAISPSAKCSRSAAVCQSSSTAPCIRLRSSRPSWSRADCSLAPLTSHSAPGYRAVHDRSSYSAVCGTNAKALPVVRMKSSKFVLRSSVFAISCPLRHPCDLSELTRRSR